MVDFLSDHFVAPLAFVEDGGARPAYRVPQAINGGYLRYKRGYVDLAGFFSADTVRLLTLRSSDRLHWMGLSTGFLSMSIDLGIWDVGSLHDGPVVDADLFMSNVNIQARSQIEALTEAGTVTDEQRGSQLWEMLGLSSDPKISYDIVADRTVSTGIGAMLLEAMFTREGS
jgi:hypothetical protein